MKIEDWKLFPELFCPSCGEHALAKEQIRPEACVDCGADAYICLSCGVSMALDIDTQGIDAASRVFREDRLLRVRSILEFKPREVTSGGGE